MFSLIKHGLVSLVEVDLFDHANFGCITLSQAHNPTSDLNFDLVGLLDKCQIWFLDL